MFVVVKLPMSTGLLLTAYHFVHYDNNVVLLPNTSLFQQNKDYKRLLMNLSGAHQCGVWKGWDNISITHIALLFEPSANPVNCSLGVILC